MLRCKVDQNQKDIVNKLRLIGCAVIHLHTVGKGCPDLLVWYKSKYYLFEIKRDTKARLTSCQIDFIARWPGQICIVTSFEDCKTILLNKQLKGVK